MQFTRFKIKNFRGIQNLSVDLDRTPQASVFTIVGLNESGKSTILEALSQMGRKAMNLSAPDPERTGTTYKQYQSFIPVLDRYNFNGFIELESKLKFSNEDIKKLRNFLESELQVNAKHISGELTINKQIGYEDSSYKSINNLWSLDPLVRRKKGRKEGVLSQFLGNEAWLKFVNFIEATMLPHILYFRSEVFDFPNKITIWTKRNDSKSGSPEKNRSEINKFYCGVIEDILHAIDPSMTIEGHIVARKKSRADKDGQNLAALLHKISSDVTQTVMEQWEKIFQRRLSDKRVVVSCDFDEDGNIYLQFKILDGSQLFDIADRSAGFRWFFSFIVLTQYRGKKVDSALFLYDEPASNLHSSAQKQLIDCFQSMPEHFKAIYTTHSHYLINPDWLDATFISQNMGMVPDELSFDFNSTSTDIRLTPYRRFVSENPSKVSYFQPVLDVIQYSPSRLESVNPCVLLEGKNDFYGLKYLFDVCLGITLEYDLVPCGGAGTVDQLIALYAGWGRSFVVLLDSDKEGGVGKRRYVDKFGSLVRNNIIIYEDINNLWNGFALEKVIGISDLQAIQNDVFPDSKYDKKQFCLAIQELLCRRRVVALTNETIENVRVIYNHLKAVLNA